MTTQHFKERFTERVSSLNISNEELKKLHDKSLIVSEQSRVDSESVCIHIFDDELVSHDGENELWVIVRNNSLRTILRRSSENTKYTSTIGFDVDKISYQVK